MLRVTRLEMGLGVLALAGGVTGCSSDEVLLEPEGGGAGGSSSGGAAGSGASASSSEGGSTASGRSGGSASAGGGECVDSFPTDDDLCLECACGTCEPEWAACQDDPNCVAARECYRDTGCQGPECQEPGVCVELGEEAAPPGSTDTPWGNLETCLSRSRCCGRMISMTSHFVDAETQEPLAGVRYCLVDHPDIPCGETDANGEVRIEDVPGNGINFVSVQLSGYMSRLIGYGVGNLDFVQGDGVSGMDRIETYEAWATAAGTTYDPTKAIISFTTRPSVGVEATLEPMSGVGPVYVTDPDDNPDPSLGTDSPKAGRGHFWNVDVGDGEVEMVHTSATSDCSAWWRERQGSSSNSVRVPVMAGHMTTGSALDIRCDGVSP